MGVDDIARGLNSHSPHRNDGGRITTDTTVRVTWIAYHGNSTRIGMRATFAGAQACGLQSSNVISKTEKETGPV
jgi:hypothetical protein